MKSHQEPDNFKPITITLETKEEARELWYRANVAVVKIEGSVC